MPSESFILIQTVLLVTLVSWAKAGLTEWGSYLIAAIIVIGLIGTPWLRQRETGGKLEIPWKASVPILIFTLLGVIGLFNPSFRNPQESLAYVDKEIWLATAEIDLKAKQSISAGNNSNPQEIADHYVFLKERLLPQLLLFQKKGEEGNVDLALARFLLANRYLSDHSSDTIFKSVFDRYIHDLRIDVSPLLPSSVNKKTSWNKLYLLILIFLQGIWVHSYLRNKRFLRWLLGAMAVNCVLLAIAGIAQKLAYDPNDLRPEIWGIWEAPVKDRNYYFASFTYKNHWCSFAALGFGILAGLTSRWLRRHPRDLLRGSPVPIALLGMLILAASVLLSGSVLGIILILAIGIPFIGFLCLRLSPRSWGWKRWLLAFSITLAVPTTGIWMVFTTNLDTKNEALHKITVRWQALRDGSMPWRYYHSKDSWAMFSDKPVFGWGLGSTLPLYPLYVSGEIIEQSEAALAFAHHKERFFFAEHSHNDWFQYLAETGIVGVGLMVFTPFLALRRIRFSSPFAVWTLATCSALALFSFVDFPSRTPACSLLFAATLAGSLKYALISSGSKGFGKSSLPMRGNVD